MLSKEQEFITCMNRLKSQINTLSTSKRLKEQTSSFIPDLSSSLRISNENLKYELKYGSPFKDMLEPRDQVLEHSFTFNVDISPQDISEGSSLLQSKLYENILEQMKLFLVESISNIISIAFRFLCRGELETK